MDVEFYIFLFQVPAIPLFIVDDSVIIINYEVGYYCSVSDKTYKKKVGSFYDPIEYLLDASFIDTQDHSRINNKIWEKFKLAWMKSEDLIDVLELHGFALVGWCFGVMHKLFIKLGIYKV